MHLVILEDGKGAIENDGIILNEQMIPIAIGSSTNMLHANSDVSKFSDGTIRSLTKCWYAVNSEHYKEMEDIPDVLEEAWHRGLDDFFLSLIRN